MIDSINNSNPYYQLPLSRERDNLAPGRKLEVQREDPIDSSSESCENFLKEPPGLIKGVRYRNLRDPLSQASLVNNGAHAERGASAGSVCDKFAMVATDEKLNKPDDTSSPSYESLTKVDYLFDSKATWAKDSENSNKKQELTTKTDDCRYTERKINPTYTERKINPTYTERKINSTYNERKINPTKNFSVSERLIVPVATPPRPASEISRIASGKAMWAKDSEGNWIKGSESSNKKQESIKKTDDCRYNERQTNPIKNFLASERLIVPVATPPRPASEISRIASGKAMWAKDSEDNWIKGSENSNKKQESTTEIDGYRYIEKEKKPIKDLSTRVKSIAPIVAPPVSEIPRIAFGKAKWARYFGDIGEEPPLPEDIQTILNSPCPVFPGKKVGQSHLLVLIPKTIDGKPLTLTTLGELVKDPKQGKATKYKWYWHEVKEEQGNRRVKRSHWVLMTKGILEGSVGKSYLEQQAMVSDLARRIRIPYEVAKLLDATVSILMHYVSKEELLFSDASPSTSYIRCQEKAKENQTVVGGFSLGGLNIHRSYDLGRAGVALSRPLR